MRSAGLTAAEPGPLATPLRALLTWSRIGLQSFGGGQATQFYAYNMLVDRAKALTPAQWAETIGLCQLAPGMNLIALAALTGSDSGVLGALAAVSGLLLPSVLITAALAALFVKAAGLAVVAGAMHGVVAASVGMGLMNAVRLARPVLKACQGWLRLCAFSILCAAVGLMVFTGLPVIALLLPAGAILAAATWIARGRHT